MEEWAGKCDHLFGTGINCYCAEVQIKVKRQWGD